MLLAWVLPDASTGVLSDGWTRSAAYLPRHRRLPLLVRAGQGLAVAAGLAGERLLGSGEDDSLARTPSPAP
jgi:hypothetical protein